MALDDDFKAAADNVQKLSSRPSNADLLELYALYKQGSGGDVTGSRPGAFSFQARAKYDAWAAKKGLAQDDAKQKYVDFVAKLGG